MRDCTAGNDLSTAAFIPADERQSRVSAAIQRVYSPAVKRNRAEGETSTPPPAFDVETYSGGYALPPRVGRFAVPASCVRLSLKRVVRGIGACSWTAAGASAERAEDREDAARSRLTTTRALLRPAERAAFWQ